MSQNPAEREFSIFKTQDEKRLVFGWASISITVDGEQLEDRQGDMIDPEDLEDTVYEYVLNFRDTGEEHIPSMRKKGKLVESCVLTEEKQRAMGIPSGIVPVGWWIGFKIEDDDAWERVKNGTYRMFSIEGRANREPVEKAVDSGKGTLFIGLNVTGADDLAMAGGESPEDFHVTLLYGYFNTNGHDSSEVDSIVNSAVNAIKADVPDTIEFDRIGTFDPSESSDGKRVIFAGVKRGQLEEIHEKLMTDLKNRGLPVEDTFPEYRPHMTLAYVDPDEEVEEEKISATGRIRKITIGLKGRDKEMNNTRTVAKTFLDVLGLSPVIGKDHPERFDQIEEVFGKSERFDHIEEIQKYNDKHDRLGRFAPKNGGGAAAVTMAPNGKPRQYGKADTSDALLEITGYTDKNGKIHPPTPNSLSEYLDKDGNLSPEREALHNKIIDDMLKGKIPVDGQATMTMLGGGPASGKSSVMSTNTSKDPHSVTIDPDAFKEKLPGYTEMAAKTDKAAGFYHEESSMLAKKFAEVAYSENYNAIYDGTGDGSVNSVMKKINAARDHGYRVDAKYVSIDTEEAVRRNQKRYEDAVSKGQVPRLPNPDLVRSTHAKCSDISVACAKEFDSIEIWDNNGAKGQQKLIAKGGSGKSLKAVAGQEAAFESYLKKGESGLAGFKTLHDGQVVPVGKS